MSDLTQETVLLTEEERDAVDVALPDGASVDVEWQLVCLAQARKVVEVMNQPCPGHDPQDVRFGVGGIFYRWGCENCRANLGRVLK